MRGRTLFRGGILGVAAAALLLAPGTAWAAFHQMKVREVYPGAANDSYLVLQMLFAGENAVGGHDVALYNATGGLIDTFTFGGGVPNGSHGNNTILVGDSGVQAAFGLTPDLTDAGFNVPPSGGAACWSDGTPPDCVAWGNFTGGASLPSSAGNPESPGGVTAGKALHRSIAAGCATYLESGDDTDDSATDFSEQDPNPRNNATTPTETLCNAPNTTITPPTPPARTNDTSASFTFTASPPASASFECKLDTAAFAPCTSPQPYSSLDGDNAVTGTAHTFQVRASNASGTDPSPATHNWTVDTIDPTATITNQPANPSAGASASFSFNANESSTFQCSLEGPKPSALSSCSSGKTYTVLPDGSYTFKVRATDTAGNEGADDTYTWTVDNSLADMTSPETTITSKPPDPSLSSTAAFTYSSNEPGSTFRCALDGGGAFTPCAAAGIQYTGLSNGAHSFQVQAIDSSGNPDASPAGYSWSVAVPDPTQPPPLPTPLPDTRLTGKPGVMTKDRTPTFRFQATITPATFECRLDGAAFKACRSPFTTKPLSFGRHTVQVRARAGGRIDPSPAKSSFKVVKRKKARRR